MWILSAVPPSFFFVRNDFDMDEMKPSEWTADEQTQSPYTLQGILEVSEEQQPPASYRDLHVVAFLAMAWGVALVLIILAAWCVRRLARHKG